MVKSLHKKHQVDGSGLKMVLKIGGSESSHVHVHKHKHKKHKKHHHNKDKRLKDAAIKKESIDQDLEGSMAINDPSSSKQDPMGVSEKSKQSLKKLLDHFLHHLQKRDVDSFFARPVNAAEAPGILEFKYSGSCLMRSVWDRDKVIPITE
jgi:CRISPR/Cas system-associated protein Cas10 (large subunit of type III CRISPR-Cas system)